MVREIFRDPPKPPGYTERCIRCNKRPAMSASLYCADCWDWLVKQVEWFQRQGNWSGKPNK